MTKKNNYPNFIGIGAPKCATSWLSDCLNEHPSIFVPPIKEVNFFGPIDKFFLDYVHNTYPRGLGWYKKYFDTNKHYACKGEFSPWYFYSDEIAANIKKHFPEAKIIIVLRNPTDRLYSFYLHIKAKHDIDDLPTLISTQPDFIEQGFYIEHINRYRELFTDSQIKIILYDDIQKNPLKCIQDIYTYLGVFNEFEPPSAYKIVNATAPKISSFTGKNRILINKLKDNRIFNYLASRINKLPWLKNTITKVLNSTTQKNTYLTMNKETRQKLIKIYKPYNKKLSKFLNVDLAHWDK